MSCFRNSLRDQRRDVPVPVARDRGALLRRCDGFGRGRAGGGRRSLLVVRYEDVVADLRGEAMKLMDFLGQPWTDDVLKYTETASRRKSTRRARRKSSSRSIRVHWGSGATAAQLAPVLPVLEPWVRKFGY